jgi:hypothetical protein
MSSHRHKNISRLWRERGVGQCRHVATSSRVCDDGDEGEGVRATSERWSHRSTRSPFGARKGVQRRGEEPPQPRIWGKSGKYVDEGVASGWESPPSRIWGEGEAGGAEVGEGEVEGEAQTFVQGVV